MCIPMFPAWAKCGVLAKRLSAALALSLLSAAALLAAPAEEVGGEANLRLPDLSSVSFLGIDGHKLLLFGIGICILGLLFGMTIFVRLKNMPVHRSMREISELIYETCKTYLVTQGKFLLLLWIFHRRDDRVLFRLLAPVAGICRGHVVRSFCCSA